MLRRGGYHRGSRAASLRLGRRPRTRAETCPLCGERTDRFGECERGHPPVRVSGVTYRYRDHRDNLIVDVDAPVLAWRQDKGHRLGFENSHEALAWNVFRALEVGGAAGTTFAALLDVGSAVTLYYWGRDRDAAPFAPFADARAALEEHLRGPDVNGAEPDVIVVEATTRVVVFVDADVAAPVAVGRAPRWFATAATAVERRRRRAILDGMTREEEDTPPFRRGLDDAIRRGFYRQARRLLLARATARRLGDGWSGRLLGLINPSTMRRAREHVARFRALLSDAGAASYLAATWADLWARVPEGTRARRDEPGRPALEEYLRRRTVNRAPALLIP